MIAGKIFRDGKSLHANASVYRRAGYNENSFWYYTEARYRAFVPEITARFQSSRLVTTFPTEWHARHNIPYVTANLIALKDPMPRNGGACFW